MERGGTWAEDGFDLDRRPRPRILGVVEIATDGIREMWSV
jgi:hypothetical protein